MATEADLREACKPWREGSLEIPEWDSPLHEVFQAGMSYMESLLAKRLGVTNYDACDGTESIDGDATGTLVNILIAAGYGNDDDGLLTANELRADLHKALSDLMSLVEPMVKGDSEFSATWRAYVRKARAALSAVRLDAPVGEK